MSAQIDKSNDSFVKMRYAINAQDCCVLKREESDDEEEEVEESKEIEDTGEKSAFSPQLVFASRPKQIPVAKENNKQQVARSNNGSLNWAQTAKSKEGSMKSSSAPDLKAMPKDKDGNKQQSNVGLINFSKIDSMLHPSFTSMSQDMKDFATVLMQQHSLMPFQLTIGLCDTLSIANTEAAKKRAKNVLYKLSKNPNVQLTNLSNVGRYIMSGSVAEPAVVAKPAPTPVTSTPSPHEMIDAFDVSNVGPSAVDASPKDPNQRCIIS